MSWIGDKVGEFRQVPNPYFSMHITGKFLFGGFRCTIRCSAATIDGGISAVAAWLIAIPSVRIVLGGKKK